MTVAELIKELQTMDGDMEVHFVYNYGDHWRTSVAPKVTGIEEGQVTYSAYHNMDKLVNIDEVEDADDDKVKDAVLIYG